MINFDTFRDGIMNDCLIVHNAVRVQWEVVEGLLYFDFQRLYQPKSETDSDSVGSATGRMLVNTNPEPDLECLTSDKIQCLILDWGEELDNPFPSHIAVTAVVEDSDPEYEGKRLVALAAQYVFAR